MIKRRVLILLSTYNGEKYLQEQLDSLINQKKVEVHFLIRDDGSSDNTLKILQEFQSNIPNTVLLKENNIGCANSFMRLIKVAGSLEKDFDYFAFCDQDDVWLEYKLFAAVSKLNVFNKSQPSLYCSHQQLVNNQLVKLPSKSRDLSCSFGEAMVTNAAVGCTVVFNKKLLDMINLYRPTCITMHDSWAYRTCLAVGGNVFYDKNANILYRQHANNVIGGSPGFLTKWKRRIKLFYNEQSNIRKQAAENLLMGYDSYITIKNRAILLQIVNYQSSFKSKLKLIFNNDFNTNSFEHNLMFKLAVLLEKY